jgi:hypothetical protein
VALAGQRDGTGEAGDAAADDDVLSGRSHRALSP